MDDPVVDFVIRCSHMGLGRERLRYRAAQLLDVGPSGTDFRFDPTGQFDRYLSTAVNKRIKVIIVTGTFRSVHFHVTFAW